MNVLVQLWGLAPVAVFGGMVAVWYVRGAALVDAWLRAAAWWAAGVWGLSNVLGLVGGLNVHMLRPIWGLCALIGFGYLYKHYKRPVMCPSWRGLTWLEYTLAGGVAVLVLAAGVTAVLAPPSTVDVLSYHGPRQLMWLQQRSLDHFLTVNDRQLMMPPLAEVIGMQFLALTGSDRWMNLPQWFAYVTLPVAVASILFKSGASRLQALSGAWLAVCLPMAYAEASNAKNDLIGTLWIILLLREVVLAKAHAENWERGSAVRTGVTLGLALLTKSTAFIFAPPLLAAGLLAWRRVRNPPLWKTAATAALATVIIAAPFYARNLVWYGTPLGEHRAEDGGHQENETLTPVIVVSNALRGTTQHLAAHSDAWNGMLERGVRTMHGWMGISADDERTTCWGASYDVVYAPNGETQAAAPWHFLMIGAGLGAVFAGGRRAVELRWLAWVCVAMTVLYCAVLKWQPWAPRLQQPVFVVGIVLAVLATGMTDLRRQAVLICLLAAGGLAAWWPGREIAARPLLRPPSIITTDRTALGYRYMPLLRDRDDSMARIVQEARAKNLLIVSIHDMPFSLMRRLQQEVPGVHFYGAPASDAQGNPDAILHLGLLSFLPLHHVAADGTRYRLVGDYAGDGIYLLESLVVARGWTERLPSFAGWSGHAGFAFRKDAGGPDGAIIWGEMAGREGSIDYEASGREVRLTAAVVASLHQPEFLRLMRDGRQLAVVELKPDSGVQHFECKLTGLAGVNRLTLVRSSNDAPLKFTRLQLNEISD